MKKYIVLSVNHNVDYMYFLPLTVWTWRKIGWEPIVFYRGEGNPVYDLIMKGIDNIRVLQPLEGVRDATIAQVSRLYAGCIKELNDMDYLMLGDCDMLALSDYWHPDHPKVTVYNHDLTGFGEIPMCYVGAPKHLWVEIMKTYHLDYDQAIKRDFQDYPNAKSQDFYQWWGCDQQVLTERLKQYGTGKIDFINRGQGSHGYARGRVDRATNGWVLDQPELIDAHLEQQTWQNDEKLKRLFNLLHTVWPKENWAWFIEYTKEFRKLAV